MSNYAPWPKRPAAGLRNEKLTMINCEPRLSGTGGGAGSGGTGGGLCGLPQRTSTFEAECDRPAQHNRRQHLRSGKCSRTSTGGSSSGTDDAAPSSCGSGSPMSKPCTHEICCSQVTNSALHQECPIESIKFIQIQQKIWHQYPPHVPTSQARGNPEPEDTKCD